MPPEEIKAVQEHLHSVYPTPRALPPEDMSPYTLHLPPTTLPSIYRGDELWLFMDVWAMRKMPPEEIKAAQEHLHSVHFEPCILQGYPAHKKDPPPRTLQ